MYNLSASEKFLRKELMPGHTGVTGIMKERPEMIEFISVKGMS
jgi:hypothetical protein